MNPKYVEPAAGNAWLRVIGGGGDCKRDSADVLVASRQPLGDDGLLTRRRQMVSRDSVRFARDRDAVSSSRIDEEVVPATSRYAFATTLGVSIGPVLRAPSDE